MIIQLNKTLIAAAIMASISSAVSRPSGGTPCGKLYPGAQGVVIIDGDSGRDP